MNVLTSTSSVHRAAMIDGPWTDERIGLRRTPYSNSLGLSRLHLMVTMCCMQCEGMSRDGGDWKEHAENKAGKQRKNE